MIDRNTLHRTINKIRKITGPVKERELRDILREETNFKPNVNKQKYTERNLTRLTDSDILRKLDSESVSKREYILDSTPQKHTTDSTVVKTVKDGSVRITHPQQDRQLLIQPSKRGYQLTTWWEQEDKQSQSSADTHIRLPETELFDQPSGNQGDTDNTTQRTLMIANKLTESEEDISIIDPSPESSNLKDGTAQISVALANDIGYEVEVERFGHPTEQTLNSEITLPFIDPVQNTNKFYDVLEETRTHRKQANKRSKSNAA